MDYGQNFLQEFLVRLFFAIQDGPKTVATLLEQRRVCHVWLGQLQTEVEQGLTKNSFDQVVYQFRIGQLEAILCWLKTHASVLAAPAGHRKAGIRETKRLPAHRRIPG